MSSAQPEIHTEPAAIARSIIRKTGGSIVMALPLGIGKPNHIVNALFDAALAERTLQLKIFTALTLERPVPGSELEKRFLEPAMERLFGNYPPLAYCQPLRDGSLPDNIEIDEFFVLAGRWRNVPLMQQRYISANYSQVLRLVLDRGVNVVAQLVARDEAGRGDRFSLSCNPDITAGLLAARAAGDARFILAGQVNSELPFMESKAALVRAHDFDCLLDSPETDFELFSVPKRPVGPGEYAMGLHAASLVKDGGTLQIGIGLVGDAVSRMLILRQQDNAAYQQLLVDLNGTLENARVEPFSEGLYGASEMLVDGFVQLEQAGVLKREVAGALVHAGFFLESRAFYRTLREMPAERRRRFAMMPISFTNTLDGDTAEKRRDRKDARFINSAMMATLLGAVISDATEDGQVVSGVGGQFDFVRQGLALAGARSIITLDATRQSGGKTVSNILWSYGHTTIPRHMRDIVITEYGVADLRGKSDAEVIAAMLAITDSRFQPGLLQQARQAGKIPQNYSIPARYRNNTPGRIRATFRPLQRQGLLADFPFGSDFNDDELLLLPALAILKKASAARRRLARLLLRGVLAGQPSRSHSLALERMQLDRPRGIRERVYRGLLHGALQAADDESC